MRKLYHRTMSALIILLLGCIIHTKGTMDARAAICLERGGVQSGSVCIRNVPSLEAK